MEDRAEAFPPFQLDDAAAGRSRAPGAVAGRLRAPDRPALAIVLAPLAGLALWVSLVAALM